MIATELRGLRRKLLSTLPALALGGWAAPGSAALADDFPTKPVRIVVPFAPGGLNDVLARMVADLLKTELRHGVIVDNRPGASGHIGAEVVAKGPADGHTLVLLATLHAGGAAYNADVVRYDLVRDFTPIGMLGSSPAVLIARKDLNIRNVAQMVALARARPGQLSFAGVGAYIGEFLEAVADVDLNLILYRGAAAAANDLLGQNVDMMSGTAADMVQLLRSGKFVALGVSGATPLPEVPDARPIVETLPEYRGGQVYGLFAPAATSPTVVGRLRAVLAQAVQSPAYRSRLPGLYVTPPDLSPEQLALDLKSSAEAFARARARKAARTATKAP